MRLILTALVAGLACLSLGSPVDDVKAGKDMELDLKGLNYTYTSANPLVGNGGGTRTDAELPSSCVAKAIGSLDITINTAALGMPFSLDIPFTGTQISPTQIRWTTNTTVNQCVPVTLNGQSISLLVKTITATLTANCASISPFWNLTCLQGYNVQLLDTNSDIENKIDAVTYAFCIETAFNRTTIQIRNIDSVGYGGEPRGTVPVQNFTVITGVLIGGGLAELAASDNNRVLTMLNPDQEDPVPIMVDFECTAPAPSLGYLELRLEARADADDREMQFQIYDNVLADWVGFPSFPITSNDVVYTFSLGSNVNNYIEPGTRLVRAKAIWTSGAADVPTVQSADLDFAIFAFTP